MTDVTGDILLPTLGCDSLVIYPPTGEGGLEYPAILGEPAFVFVETNVSVPVTQSAPTYPYAYMEASFPIFGMTGEAEYSLRANGDGAFPALQTDGLVEWPLFLTGPVTFSAFMSDANLEIDIVGASAKLSFPKLMVDGQCAMPFAGQIEAEFPSFESTIDVHMPLWADSNISLPGFTAAGLADLPLALGGDLTFATFTVEGEIEVLIPDGYMVEGISPFAKFGVEGEGVVPFGGKAEVAFPPMLAEGAGIVPIVVLPSNPSFPGLTIDAFFSTPYRIDANMRFPKLAMDGLGGRPYDLAGDTIFPAFGASGDIRYRFKISADLTFPSFTVRVRTEKSKSSGVTIGGAEGLNFGSGVNFGKVNILKIG